ncbi:FAD-binding oxidoreductase [Candidatus Pacearchaeota archaeon]|nr:FAD-binding oxidoreductase [Candidatus Pacearchaeota archaeon]
MALQKSSSWSTSGMPHFPKLKSFLDVDVAIIGGGIAGITSAYLLSKAGKTVALCEKDTLCSGATGLTTAFLTEVLDTDFKDLVEMYGEAKAKVIIKSHRHAIDHVEGIIKKNKIECEFMRCSDYSYALDKESSEELEEEQRIARKLGAQARFRKDSLLKFENHGYMEVKRQAKFHPLKYLSSLSKIASKQGALIFEKTEVKEITGDGPYRVRTPLGEVYAQQVIVATYAPFNKKLYFKKAFYDTYVLELKMPKGILKQGIYEDTMDPYHYFRVDRKGSYDRVIIGGEDHRSDIPVKNSKNFQAVREYVKHIFSDIHYKVVREWEGPIVEPVDGLAYIGPHKDKNIFYATGFSGNGMTYGMLAAHIVTHQILGKMDKQTRQFASVYDARRIPSMKQLAYKGRDYTKELFHGAVRNTMKYRRKSI